MDLSGHRRALLRVPGHTTVYDVARDGRVLLRTDTRQLGILGMGPGEKAERDLSCLDMCSLAGISDDGSLIAADVIGESGGPNGSVYLRKTDGSPPVRLGDGQVWALSPDGKWVSAFTSQGAEKRKYVLLPTGAGEEQTISIPALRGMNVVYGWSADDTKLFVQGPGKKGWRSYLWDSQSGALTPITPNGIADMMPMPSPDRRSILTEGPDGRWHVYSIDGGDRLVAGTTPHDIPLGWRSDNRSVYVQMHHDENQVAMVDILDTATGQRTPWKEIRPSLPVERVERIMITPNGSAYAYNFLSKISELYVADGVR